MRNDSKRVLLGAAMAVLFAASGAFADTTSTGQVGTPGDTSASSAMTKGDANATDDLEKTSETTVDSTTSSTTSSDANVSDRAPASAKKKHSKKKTTHKAAKKSTKHNSPAPASETAPDMGSGDAAPAGDAPVDMAPATGGGTGSNTTMPPTESSGTAQ